MPFDNTPKNQQVSELIISFLCGLLEANAQNKKKNISFSFNFV